MFPDLISPVSDFEHQLGACFNAMSQDDAIGQILVVERMSGMLHMRHMASADLMDTDVDDYEMVIFDGGNTSGDTWKHVFFPRVSAEHYSCTKPDPSGPFRGAFSCTQHRNAGMLRCRFLRAGRPPRGHAYPMSVGAAGRRGQAVETFEAASTGNRAGRFFLRTYRVHPRHPQGTSPLRAGNPLLFLKEFPHGPFPHQIHDAFAGRRPCRNVRSFKYRVFDDQPLSSTLGFAIDPQPFDGKVVAATDDAIVVKLKPSEFAVLDPQPRDHGSCRRRQGACPTLCPSSLRRTARTRRRSSPRRLRTARRTPSRGTSSAQRPAKLPIPTPQCMELGQLIEQLEEMPAPDRFRRVAHTAGGCRCPRLHLGRSHALQIIETPPAISFTVSTAKFEGRGDDPLRPRRRHLRGGTAPSER